MNIWRFFSMSFFSVEPVLISKRNWNLKWREIHNSAKMLNSSALAGFTPPRLFARAKLLNLFFISVNKIFLSSKISLWSWKSPYTVKWKTHINLHNLESSKNCVHVRAANGRLDILNLFSYSLIKRSPTTFHIVQSAHTESGGIEDVLINVVWISLHVKNSSESLLLLLLIVIIKKIKKKRSLVVIVVCCRSIDSTRSLLFSVPPTTLN